MGPPGTGKVGTCRFALLINQTTLCCSLQIEALKSQNALPTIAIVIDATTIQSEFISTAGKNLRVCIYFFMNTGILFI
jgi:hypothetical protein